MSDLQPLRSCAKQQEIQRPGGCGSLTSRANNQSNGQTGSAREKTRREGKASSRSQIDAPHPIRAGRLILKDSRAKYLPLLLTPIRDVNDIVVMQTAVIGEADILCTKDRDFFEPPAEGFLRKAGIAVLDDISLMRQLRS